MANPPPPPPLTCSPPHPPLHHSPLPLPAPPSPPSLPHALRWPRRCLSVLRQQFEPGDCVPLPLCNLGLGRVRGAQTGLKVIKILTVLTAAA